MAIGVFLWVESASSDDLISCVDRDVRASFFHGSYEYNDNPKSREQILLSQLEDPQAFRLVGNFTSRDFQTIGFATDLDIASAEKAMVDSLAKLGFRIAVKNKEKETNRERFGFRIPALKRHEPVSMCNSNHDGANIRTRKTPSGVSVTVRFGGGRCYDRKLRDITNGEMANIFLPNLTLPPEAVITGGHGGPSGGLTHASSSVRFRTSLGATEVHSRFKDQLIEQGWAFDTGWGGESILGSTWSQVRDEGELKLIGILEVRKSLDSFHAKISVSLYN